MAPVRAGVRAREIVIGVHERRAGNMTRGEPAAPRIRIGEIVPTIDDHPRRVIEMCGEVSGRDERRKCQSQVQREGEVPERNPRSGSH